MGEENPPTGQEPAPAPEPAPSPEAAAAPPSSQPPAPQEAPPKEEQKPQEEPTGKRGPKPSAAPSGAPVLLFGKFDISGVTVRDPGMGRYMDVTPLAVPHTGGKRTNKQFAKAKMSIVERLINNMMRTEDFTGKKIKAYKAVENSFTIIHEKTKQNPLQVFVDALQNAAPREEVTRLQYGGISVPKAVDVAPSRRVDLALRNICKGSLEAVRKSKKSVEECLADEILSAARNDMNCFSVAKKEEVERVAASAR
jgi:small subunit ribosomal protein S7